MSNFNDMHPPESSIDIDKMLKQHPNVIISDFVTSHSLNAGCSILIERDADIIASIHVKIKNGCQHISSVKQFGRLTLRANGIDMLEADAEILECKYTDGKSMFRMPIGILIISILPYTQLTLNYNNYFHDTCSATIQPELAFLPSEITNIITSYEEPCTAPKVTVYLRKYILNSKINQLIASKTCMCKTITTHKTNNHTITFRDNINSAYVTKGQIQHVGLHSIPSVTMDTSILSEIYGTKINNNEIHKPAGKTVRFEEDSNVVIFNNNMLIHNGGYVGFMHRS